MKEKKPSCGATLVDGTACLNVGRHDGRCAYHAGLPSGKSLWFTCPSCGEVVQAQRMLGPPVAPARVA